MDVEHAPAMADELTEIRLRLAAALAAAVDGQVAAPVTAGLAVYELARLSGGYTPPADACPTYRTLYALLGQFDAATKKHVHLENNILFPKAIRLEEALLGTDPA